MNSERRKRLCKVVEVLREIKVRLDDEVMFVISSVLSEEQESFDNLPEGLQQSYHGESIQSNIDSLAEVYGDLMCFDDLEVLADKAEGILNRQA